MVKDYFQGTVSYLWIRIGESDTHPVDVTSGAPRPSRDTGATGSPLWWGGVGERLTARVLVGRGVRARARTAQHLLLLMEFAY